MRTIVLAFGLAAALAGAAEAAPFAKADANHDGVVTYQEAHFVMPQLAKVHFNKFARDGVVTKNQFAALSNFYDLMNRGR